MLKRNCKNRYICLVPDLRGEIFSHSLLRTLLAVDVYTLNKQTKKTRLRWFPFSLSLLSFIIMKSIQFCLMFFLHQLRCSCMFSFHSVNVNYLFFFFKPLLFIYLIYYYYYFLLYNIVLVLPCINMHLPRVYMCSSS